MKLKELYKKVRRGQEVSLDEDSMWDAIESRLEKPKKKRRFLWLWFTMGILLIGTYLSFIQDSEHSSENNKITTKTELKNTIPVNSIPVSTPLILDNNTLKTNEMGESIHNGSELPTPETINPTKGLNSYTTTDIVNVVDHELTSSTIIGIELQQEVYNDIKTSSISSIANNIQSAVNRIENIGHELVLSSVPSLIYTKIDVDYSPIRFDPMPKVNILTKFENLVDKDDSEKKHKLELAVSFDYLNLSNKITEKDPLEATWGELHKSSKTSNVSLQLSTILKYRHRSGIGIGSGVIARQISEWYDATVETITPYTMPSDSAKFAIVNGFKTFAKGVLTGRKIERTHYHTPVKRLYIDIPLELSYVKSLSKLEVELSMSYNLNISHQYYGRSYAVDQILLDQDQLNLQGVYKSRLVNSTNIGLKLNHSLTSSISIGFTLNYWRQTNSSLASISSLDERYNGFGGGLNLKKIFNN